MKLYLYEPGSKQVLLEINDAVSYTADQVVTEEGVYRPLAEGLELSSLPECTETLRADWQQDHPTDQTRIEELEALVAELLFGGGAV